MAPAIALWRLFPTQIEADLQQFYNGRRIAEWHRGEMSSRELLALLNGLPDRSKYKGAFRGYQFGVDYEWAPEEYRQAAIARQQAPLNDDGDMSVSKMLYEAYFSPVERLAMETKQQREADRVDRARKFVHAGMLGITKGG